MASIVCRALEKYRVAISRNEKQIATIHRARRQWKVHRRRKREVKRQDEGRKVRREEKGRRERRVDDGSRPWRSKRHIHAHRVLTRETMYRTVQLPFGYVQVSNSSSLGATSDDSKITSLSKHFEDGWKSGVPFNSQTIQRLSARSICMYIYLEIRRHEEGKENVLEENAIFSGLAWYAFVWFTKRSRKYLKIVFPFSKQLSGSWLTLVRETIGFSPEF